MKLIPLLKLAVLHLLRTKQTVLRSFFLTMAVLLTFSVTQTLSSAISDYQNRMQNQNYYFRLFFVGFDDKDKTRTQAMEELRTIPHVAGVVAQENRATWKSVDINTDTMDGYVEIRGVNETTCPEPIAGGMPTQPYTLMIPSVFFPDSSAETATSFPDALDGISLLGTTVLIPISETETKAYTIVGVYDAQLTLDDPHICYASFESIADMQETEPDPTNTTLPSDDPYFDRTRTILFRNAENPHHGSITDSTGFIYRLAHHDCTDNPITRDCKTNRASVADLCTK